jgi:hypothetical protein
MGASQSAQSCASSIESRLSAGNQVEDASRFAPLSRNGKFIPGARITIERYAR